MQFPLNFWDVILWLTFTAIILLITSELVSTTYSHGQVMINKRRLRITALLFGVAFMITVGIHALNIVLR